jgi:hypothetical protein
MSRKHYFYDVINVGGSRQIHPIYLTYDMKEIVR